MQETGDRNNLNSQLTTHNSTESGFTLVEAVISIVIIGILSSGIAVFLLDALEGWRDVSYRKDATQLARVAVDRMTREMRNIERKPNNKGNITYASDQMITFTDIKGNSVTFQWGGTGNPLQRNSNILIDSSNMNNLALGYYDAANIPITSFPLSLADREKIKRISIQLTAIEGNENVKMNEQVTLRNLAGY